MADGTAVRPRVLVVEDDETTLHMLRWLLDRAGFAVTTCSDGQAGVDHIRANEPPTLVVTDLMLPFVDGMGIIAAVRGQPGWEKVPILCLTSKSLERDVVRALDAGATDYVAKPFRPDELVARARRCAQRTT